MSSFISKFCSRHITSKSGIHLNCVFVNNLQVDVLLLFCKEMGLSSVVLVGHDDGGLLALKAAQRVKASPSLVDVC